jgi:23S rRNA G2069 N7-methylase RlmK/C1962 C5-methylase RlmI
MDKDNTEAKIEAQAEMLGNRLKKRLRHLSKWAKRVGTNAFRLYDRDIPEIPLVLDKYDDVVSGALYKRPYEKDQADETRWLAHMGDTVAQSLGLKRENVIIKLREKQRHAFDSQNTGQGQYEKIAERGLVREVSEAGLSFKVNLSDYLDTGLFLDRRAMRRMIRADSSGKRVLNLFCYTASFSVCAASSSGAPGTGAASTDSVDLSNTYINWASENFALNGFSTEILRIEEYFTRIPGLGIGDQGSGTRDRNSDYNMASESYSDTSNSKPRSLVPDPPSPSSPHSPLPAHRLIRADVVEFLHKAVAARRSWDIIVLDPPAFSNSTMAADFDLLRDYIKILELCLALLSPGGKLWFSAGARSFKASATEIESQLAGHFPHIAVTDLGNKVVDEDFLGKKMPKSFLIGSGDWGSGTGDQGSQFGL